MIVRAGGCAEIKRIEEFCFAVVGHRRSGCCGRTDLIAVISIIERL